MAEYIAPTKIVKEDEEAAMRRWEEEKLKYE
jgi:hypothetical protein